MDLVVRSSRRSSVASMLGSCVRRLAPAAFAALLFAVAGCGSDSGRTPSSRVSAKPQNGLATIDPANFSLPVDNPYFPLKPGTTYRHEGMKEGEPALIVYTVTHRTREVMGVTNVVVVDRLYVNGRIEEIARDWYTQDRRGNV